MKALVLGAISLLLLGGCAQSEPESICDGFISVRDTPLLTSANQVREALTTGGVAFRIGSDYYVVRGLPDEYIRYSEV